MSKYSIFLIFVAFSCSAVHNTITINDGDMENTILRNSTVVYKKVGEVKRGSIVVVSYYDKTLKKDLSKVLRVAGLPGDTVRIVEGDIYINNRIFRLPATSKFTYMARLDDANKISRLAQFSYRRYSGKFLILFVDQSELRKIKENGLVDSIQKLVADSNMVEPDIVKGPLSKFSNGYYLGPIVIPRVGDKVTSSLIGLVPNFLGTESIGESIDVKYFYLVADNFLNCYDSRNIGLVPMSAIKGVIDVK